MIFLQIRGKQLECLMGMVKRVWHTIKLEPCAILSLSEIWYDVESKMNAAHKSSNETDDKYEMEVPYENLQETDFRFLYEYLYEIDFKSIEEKARRLWLLARIFSRRQEKQSTLDALKQIYNLLPENFPPIYLPSCVFENIISRELIADGIAIEEELLRDQTLERKIQGLGLELSRPTSDTLSIQETASRTISELQPFLIPPHAESSRWLICQVQCIDSSFNRRLHQVKQFCKACSQLPDKLREHIYVLNMVLAEALQVKDILNESSDDTL